MGRKETSAEAGYSNYAVIRRFLPFMRPYARVYALAVFLLIVNTLLSLLPPILLKFIIDDAIKANSISLLNRMALYLIAVTILAGILKGSMEYLHEWVSANFISDLREALYSHIQKQSMDFFASAKIGEIIGRLRVDVTAVYGVLANTFLGALSEVVQIVGISAVLFYLNYKLAIIALSFILPLYLILTLSGKRLRRLSLMVRDKDVGLLDFFHEKISNMHVVKLYHRETYEEQNHHRLGRDHIGASLQRLRYKFSSIFLIGTLTSIASIAVIWYGGYAVIGGALSFGSLFAFYLYTVRLYGPIQSLANRGVEIYNGLASAERIIQYLNLEPTVQECAQPVRLESVRGEISFDDVRFKYPGSGSHVIEDLNLHIRPGEKVALVGPSGAGKTTIVNLLCRLYDVDGGQIRIDGHDVRQLAFKDLYDAVGVVSQDTYLFNSTIEDNIRFGRIEASRAEVVSAAKKAHLHEFIEQLPKGYDTVIGARGIKLSGGQRQRLALARMILKDSKIWILDEFTSSLDSRSEAVVYNNIKQLLEGRTTLIIAHRFSTILSADQVVVMQDGRIIEIGSHHSLYGKNGLYRKLFDTQFRGADFFNTKTAGATNVMS